MKFRKIAGVSTAMLTAAALSGTFAVCAEETGIIGSAWIYAADDNWNIQFWGGEPNANDNSGIESAEGAVITGDGSYTAEITFEKEVESLGFAALCTNIETSGCPENMTVSIDSVSVNGNEVEFAVNGTPQWKDDGGKMRVNIYNAWSGDSSDTAVDKSVFNGAKTVTVEFTVDGLEEDVPPAETAAPVTEAPAEETAQAETTVAEPQVSEDEGSEILTEDVTDLSAEEAPESDPAENNAPMGNTPASVLLALTALSAAVMAVSGKKG